MEHDTLWNNLQEPSCPTGFPTGYMLLLAAVDKGWQISGPVIAQSVLLDKKKCSYAFLLTHNCSTTRQQLIVPQCHEIDIFIRSEGLVVEDNFYLS